MAVLDKVGLTYLWGKLKTKFDEKANSAHTHDAGDIETGRLIQARLPTSSTANRVLRVGAANSNPVYEQIALGTDTTGKLPINRGGTNADNVLDARTNLGLQTGAIRRIRSGIAQVPAKANTIVSQIVPLPVGMFTAAPVVVVTPYTNQPGLRDAHVAETSTSGFTIYVASDATYTMPIMWVAVQDA